MKTCPKCGDLATCTKIVRRGNVDVKQYECDCGHIFTGYTCSYHGLDFKYRSFRYRFDDTTRQIHIFGVKSIFDCFTIEDTRGVVPNTIDYVPALNLASVEVKNFNYPRTVAQDAIDNIQAGRLLAYDDYEGEDET